MDKLKLFAIWLDGYLTAIGNTPTLEQTQVIRDRLNNLFEHEAESIELPQPIEEDIPEFPHYTTPPFDEGLLRC